MRGLISFLGLWALTISALATASDAVPFLEDLKEADQPRCENYGMIQDWPEYQNYLTAAERNRQEAKNEKTRFKEHSALEQTLKKAIADSSSGYMTPGNFRLKAQELFRKALEKHGVKYTALMSESKGGKGDELDFSFCVTAKDASLYNSFYLHANVAEKFGGAENYGYPAQHCWEFKENRKYSKKSGFFKITKSQYVPPRLPPLLHYLKYQARVHVPTSCLNSKENLKWNEVPKPRDVDPVPKVAAGEGMGFPVLAQELACDAVDAILKDKKLTDRYLDYLSKADAQAAEDRILASRMKEALSRIRDQLAQEGLFTAFQTKKTRDGHFALKGNDAKFDYAKKKEQVQRIIDEEFKKLGVNIEAQFPKAAPQPLNPYADEDLSELDLDQYSSYSEVLLVMQVGKSKRRMKLNYTVINSKSEPLYISAHLQGLADESWPLSMPDKNGARKSIRIGSEVVENPQNTIYSTLNLDSDLRSSFVSSVNREQELSYFEYLSREENIRVDANCYAQKNLSRTQVREQLAGISTKKDAKKDSESTQEIQDLSQASGPRI